MQTHENIGGNKMTNECVSWHVKIERAGDDREPCTRCHTPFDDPNGEAWVLVVEQDGLCQESKAQCEKCMRKFMKEAQEADEHE